MKLTVVVVLLVFSTAHGYVTRPENGPLLKEKYAWSSVDFIYASPDKKKEDLRSNRYIPEDVIVFDGDAFVGSDGQLREFVTTPSLKPGIPFSLSLITNQPGKGGPKLKPFPDEKWHNRGNCDSITNAFRIKIDKKGRLWVLDTGKLDVFAASLSVPCQPQILAFDLNNQNRLIKRYRIPESLIETRTLFVNLEVEIAPDDTYVYLADPVSLRMLVYKMSTDTAFSFNHPYFYPDPLYGFYDLNGANFTLMDGLFGLSLMEGKTPDRNTLYFHSLSSGRQSLVRTNVLRSEQMVKDRQHDFKTSTIPRKSHVSMTTLTKSGIMIFCSLEDNAIFGWDVRTEYHPKNLKLLVRDADTLQFPTGMKIVGDDLYVTTSRLQNVIAGTVARGVVNYRVLVGKVDRVLAMRNKRSNPLIFLF